MSVTGYSTQRIYGNLTPGNECLIHLHRFALVVGEIGVPNSITVSTGGVTTTYTSSLNYGLNGYGDVTYIFNKNNDPYYGFTGIIYVEIKQVSISTYNIFVYGTNVVLSNEYIILKVYVSCKDPSFLGEITPGIIQVTGDNLVTGIYEQLLGTIYYGDSSIAHHKQCAYKYSGYLSILWILPGETDPIAASEIRICKKNPKNLVIETYGVATPTNKISLWFNSGSLTTPVWTQLNSSTNGTVMPYAQKVIKFTESISEAKGSLKLTNCKTCPDHTTCLTCDILSKVTMRLNWVSGGWDPQTGDIIVPAPLVPPPTSPDDCRFNAATYSTLDYGVTNRGTNTIIIDESYESSQKGLWYLEYKLSCNKIYIWTGHYQNTDIFYNYLFYLDDNGTWHLLDEGSRSGFDSNPTFIGSFDFNYLLNCSSSISMSNVCCNYITIDPTLIDDRCKDTAASKLQLIKGSNILYTADIDSLNSETGVIKISNIETVNENYQDNETYVTDFTIQTIQQNMRTSGETTILYPYCGNTPGTGEYLFGKYTLNHVYITFKFDLKIEQSGATRDDPLSQNWRPDGNWQPFPLTWGLNWMGLFLQNSGIYSGRTNTVVGIDYSGGPYTAEAGFGVQQGMVLEASTWLSYIIGTFIRTTLHVYNIQVKNCRGDVQPLTFQCYPYTSGSIKFIE